MATIEICNSKLKISPYGNFVQAINYIEKYFIVDYFLILSFINKKYHSKFDPLLRLDTKKSRLSFTILGKSSKFYLSYNPSWYDMVKFDFFYHLWFRLYFAACITLKRNKIINFWIQSFYKYFALWRNDITDKLDVYDFLVNCYKNPIPKSLEGFKFCQRWRISICKISCMVEAISENDVEYVDYLLENLSFKQKHLFNLLKIAVCSENHQIVQLITDYCNIGNDNSSKKIMNCALRQKNFEIIKILYENGYDVLRRMPRQIELTNDDKLINQIKLLLSHETKIS